VGNIFVLVRTKRAQRKIKYGDSKPMKN